VPRKKNEPPQSPLQNPEVLDFLTLAERKELDEMLAIIDRPTLAQYVATIKQFALDPWQIDLCNRLEKAFWLAQAQKFAFVDLGNYIEAPSGFLILREDFKAGAYKGGRVAIHAAPQFGKSIIISQCYPCWILGYDPIHRFRLATYNIFHSARFSVVIKHILASGEHKQFFPGSETAIAAKSKAVEWSTQARLKINDGQASFTALGLQSGFTGTGADTLLIDDPYKSMDEALSEIIRDKTWRFHTDTASPRLNDQSNEFIMFHRYHQDDMGGRALATGEFDLWRYAAEADGDYVDEQSGREFPDPLGRKEGEVLSPRFSESYYARQKINEQVWNSQFQGRPVSKAGNLFDVSKLRAIDLPMFVHQVRAWDNAATEGGGAYTAGVRMGVTATGRFVITNVKREQVGSAERDLLQHTTADEDGLLVEIHGPQDPGSAGKDVAFQFQRELAAKQFNVTVSVVSGSKEMRAYPFSQAVNSGQVDIVDDGTWDVKAFKDELHNFPLSTYKDQVDAGSDAYSHLYRLFHRGLIIKNFYPLVNLVPWSGFRERFGQQIPGHWEVSGGLRIEADNSRPSGWILTARAGENANLGEVVFVVASRRNYKNDVSGVLKDFVAAIEQFCQRGTKQCGVMWVKKGNTEVMQLAQEKFDLTLYPFDDDEMAGVPETNWYFQFEPQQVHPFYKRMGASRCYLLVDDEQISVPSDDEGLLATRQEITTWGYNDLGEPQQYGGVTLDCLRMTLYNFSLSAAAMTDDERRISRLPDDLKPAAVLAHLGQNDFVDHYMAQKHALNRLKIQEQEERKKLVEASRKVVPMPFRRRTGRLRNVG
jgi:phage terminase large subunit-like protein